jgi:hypothetical protein
LPSLWIASRDQNSMDLSPERKSQMNLRSSHLDI